MPVMTGLFAAGPDRLSVQANVTVTLWFVQPPAYEELAVIAGGVWSMLMPETRAAAEFPALSVAEPGTLWFAPFAESVIAEVQVAIPDCSAPAATGFSGLGSTQTNATVTGVLYQPLAFAGLVGAPEIVGGVVSMLMPVTVVLVEFPAASVAVPEAL